MTTATAAFSIASDFSLPVDAITETIAVLAVKGAGKTNTAVVLAEEMIKAGLQVVALDPVGPWWGLRAAGDGPGLPVLVMGGEHGDLPLAESDADAVAEFLATEPVPAVLDLSQFTKGEQTRFVAAFADRLWQVKAREQNRTPMMLILEESDEFAPQKPQRDEAVMLGRIERLCKLGRNRGIGMTLVTQRSASLNKNVLSQVSLLMLMRTPSPQDRKAVLEWVDAHADEQEAAQVMQELASLPVGTAWVWSPGWLKLLRRVQIRRRETFDSSATPKVGELRNEPKQLADVDIEAFKAKLGQVIDQGKNDDPRVLRQRIAELEKALFQKERAAPEKIVERVEVPVIPRSLIDLVYDNHALSYHMVAAVEGKAGSDGATADLPQVPITTRSAIEALTNGPAVPVSPEPVAAPEEGGWPPKLKAGQLRMLSAIAAHPDGALTRVQMGTLSHMTPGAGAFSDYISKLKQYGLVEELGGSILRITSLGRALVGEQPRLQTTEELVAMWSKNLKAGQRRMLAELVRIYPNQLSRLRLGERVQMTPGTGAFGDYISRLKRNGLVLESKGGGLKASPTLFLERKD